MIVFAMLPLAPTYITVLATQVCTRQHFPEDVAEGQVAYSSVAFCIPRKMITVIETAIKDNLYYHFIQYDHK